MDPFSSPPKGGEAASTRSFPLFIPLQLSFHRRSSGWRHAWGKATSSSTCSPCWQRIGGWGEEVYGFISCFSSFACKDFRSFHYTESQSFLFGGSGWENPHASVCQSQLSPAPLAAGECWRGSTHFTGPTFPTVCLRVARVCLEHALSFSAHEEGRYFSSHSCQLPTYSPDFKKGIPSLPHPITRRGKGELNSCWENGGKLFGNDRPSSPSLDTACC